MPGMSLPIVNILHPHFYPTIPPFNIQHRGTGLGAAFRRIMVSDKLACASWSMVKELEKGE